MSDVFFPKLPGLSWDVERSYTYATLIQPAAAPGHEVRVSLSDQCQVGFKLSYEVIRDNRPDSDSGQTDLMTIVGFFRQRRGAFDSFLLNVTDLSQNDGDSLVTGANIGIGDGTTKNFQVTRPYGGDTENCFAPQVLELTVDGTAQTLGVDYAMTNGMVGFVSAPAIGAVIMADYLFCYRVRFEADMLAINNFLFALYNLQEVKLLSLAG